MQELPKTKLLEVLERFPQEKKQLRLRIPSKKPLGVFGVLSLVGTHFRQVAAQRMEWKSEPLAPCRGNSNLQRVDLVRGIP